MKRHLALALFAVVVGCADEQTKVAPAMPVAGDGVSRSEIDSEGEGDDDGGDPTLVADNESGEQGSTAPCGVSFTKDLMPKLAVSCASAACHKDVAEPFVESDTPQITYEALRDFGFDDESWTDPHPSESGLADPALAAAVDGWRKCGAPFE